MRRNEFLTELRNGLTGHVSHSELEDILSDYHELFEEGLLEGKSEEEICSELGSPAQTVKLILAEGYDSDKIAGGRQEKLYYAPLYKRITAGVIDHVLSVFPLAFFGIVNVLPFMMIWPPISLFYPVDTTPPSAGMAAGAIVCLCYYICYHPFFLILFKGRTPGKMLLQLCVVNQDGNKPSIPQILGREFMGRLLINSVTFGIGYLVSFFWCLFSAENKTIHDAIANTRVVIHEHSPFKR
jgi:uncharacterized RDD family membrane protein YckC